MEEEWKSKIEGKIERLEKILKEIILEKDIEEARQQEEKERDYEGWPPID